MPRKIVIIGANVDAASSARKTDRDAEITLITREDKGAYSRCGLPFVIGGHIPRFEDLIVYPPSYYRMMKLNLKLETEAKKIDVSKRVVEVESKQGTESIEFDSLILATGARPFIPPIKGVDKKGIFTLRTIEDGKSIAKAIETAKSAVVVGAGFIGLETAVGLVERGVKTTVVELLPYIMPTLFDKDMADRAMKMLEDRGLKFIIGKSVDEFLGGERVSSVSVEGEEIPADLVIVATGVRANVELAKEAGIAIGESRGIRVDRRMQTSCEGIYAAGDCAESTCRITGSPIMVHSGTNAARQAKVAGINAAGGYAVMEPALGSAVSKMFDIEVGATGITEYMAKKRGMEVVSATFASKTRAEYYPGAKPIWVKVIVEREMERIVGVQMIGGEEITQRVNAISFGIMKQMTVRDLAKADTCYAPPLNQTWEPMVLAAEMALRKL
ncbi:MAG: FAD-dependent oxidoreductase [Candidatus Bathyarchaeia archaeon]